MRPIKINNWEDGRLEVYNGKISLVLGYLDKNGEFKPKFCKREFGKDRIEKVAPLSLPLGDNKTEAIVFLNGLIEELKEESQNQPTGRPYPGNDIPF
jgi:hypothetical protein